MECEKLSRNCVLFSVKAPLFLMHVIWRWYFKETWFASKPLYLMLKSVMITFLNLVTALHLI